ncbi:Hypothetical protein A7982_10881 [Minicystis rosea]|nr:Hypothetical protein A7982_10881 [Minicystis rosea]
MGHASSSRRARPWVVFAAAAAFALTPAIGHADPPAQGAERRAGYSPYEKETIDRALTKVRGSIDSAPEGKILEGVEIVTLEVFEDRDPLPNFLTPIANWFHHTSRRNVVEREVLVPVGGRWEQALVDQSARNLRALAQLSLVLTVPLRGSATDRVRLLVITKDVWSLRLNSDFRFAGGRLQYLLLQPSEMNLLGTHQTISGNFEMNPATFAVGGSYTMPRIANSRIDGSISASAIINRETGRVEGTYGSLSYGQPLYSMRTKWAWGASVSWDQRIVRRFIGGLATDFDPASGACAIAGTKPMDGTGGRRCEYRRDLVTGSYAVTRSFGETYKHDVTVGFSANRRQYRTLDLSGLDADQQAAFKQAIVPVSDTQIGPYVEYHAYSTRFFDILDLDTLGLTESYRRGHDVTVRVTPITKALNSDRNFVSVSASATYTQPLGDGLVRASVGADTEFTMHGIPDGAWSAALRIATPRFGRGRLVFDAKVLDRYNNYLNTKTTLGGEGRLRGYPADMFIGKDYVVANLEYRSDPIEILAVQLGFTLFVDTGDAFDTWRQMRLKQSTGLGLRMVFPQLQRSALRIDLGFPLTPDAVPDTTPKADLVVTYGQAF